MSTVEFDELSTTQLIAIDKCCTEFEQALRNKKNIPIESLLDSVTTDIQRSLFKELLYSDLAYRRQRGDSINRDEYHDRFPDFIDQIDEVWMSVFTFKENPDDTPATDNLSFNVSSGLTIRGYKIKKRLARGGMGVVYLAQDTKLDREVAIKMLSSDNMPLEQTERFQMEARAISALHHPNIIQIYSVGEHHGQPYLVLEYADAGTLKDRLEDTAFQREQVLDIMLMLVKAIEFVHQKGFLHRDLKPSNVLFDHEDNIKISDFGLAKDMSAATELTHTQSLMGTPAYMAPEQVDHHFGKLSELSDIYSLGVLMHTLLTGMTPYDGLSAPELLKELASEKDVPKTYLLEHNIDKALMMVCLRCLEKQPRHRYQSASLLSVDLQRLRSGKPVSSRPLYRKYIERYLKPVTLSAMLLISAGYLLERTTQTSPEVSARTSLLASKVIAQLDPAVLASLNTPSQGKDDFKLVNLLPAVVAGDTNPLLKSPQGLALYQDRYLYIADTLNHRVLMIDLITGDIAHVAGNGEASYSGDDGLARNASLNQPVGLDVDSAGHLYITDRGNHALRMVNIDGIITTLSGGVSCKKQSKFTNLLDLCYPADISVVSAAEYYIADAFNQRIRYTHDESRISSVFENETTDTSSDFSPHPRAIAYDDGLLYFIEGHTGRLRSMDEAGTLNTLAEGFIEPTDISLDNKGNIYVSDEAGYPITRVNKTSGAIEVLAHDRLFSDSSNTTNTQTTTAITVGNDNRLFFSSAINNSIAVIIMHQDKPELILVRREKENMPQPLQYPLTRLDEIDRFSYINTDRREFFSDIAYRLSLHLYMHHSSVVYDEINVVTDRFTARNILIFGCLVHSVSCGIEGNTLIVAAPDIFPSITTATPLKINDPLSFIENSDAMPNHLKQEAQREIKIEPGLRKMADEFFLMLEELSLYKFDIDPDMKKFGEANISLDGSFMIGPLLAVFVIWEKIHLSYDEDSGRLKVRIWKKQK